jgi:hypothetical protein
MRTGRAPYKPRETAVNSQKSTVAAHSPRQLLQPAPSPLGQRLPRSMGLSSQGAVAPSGAPLARLPARRGLRLSPRATELALQPLHLGQALVALVAQPLGLVEIGLHHRLHTLCA